MPRDMPWLNAELSRLAEQGLVRRRGQVTPLADGRCLVDGKTLKNFASNDYLNLAHDARLIEAARGALEEYGVGSGASALVTGRTDWHVRLEQRLAQFEGQPAAILFPTGFAANLGTITALTGSEGMLFSDRLNHASLIDGCRLSGARIVVYEHDKLDQLRRALAQSSGELRRLIVTDSLFSMDGDMAPMVELCALAERYDAAVLIDEAHATGVFGAHGRGVAEMLSVEDRVSVRVGTLSKALGSLGGFVTGSHALVDWLWNRARTQVFSTALPPSLCAAACTAIDIVEQEPWRRTRLLETADAFRKGLIHAGIETCRTSCGPIVPVILQSPQKVVAVGERLRHRGFVVGAIRPPSVPKGTSRLRVTFSAAHTLEDQAELLDALVRILGREARGTDAEG